MYQVGQQMPGGLIFKGWKMVGGKYVPLVQQRDGTGTMIHPAYQAKPATSTQTGQPSASTSTSGGGGQGSAAGQNPYPQLNPTNLWTGQHQLIAAQHLQSAKNDATGLNSELADLQANGMGRFNTREQVINRDVMQGKHDYNAQSNAMGFRHSGGVHTNNQTQNAIGETNHLQNYNTLGQGRINQIGVLKNQIANDHIQQLLGQLGGDFATNIYGTFGAYS